MSMMVSFVLSFFPRDVLDEILNLIGSVSEDFPSYSYTPGYLCLYKAVTERKKKVLGSKRMSLWRNNFPGYVPKIMCYCCLSIISSRTMDVKRNIFTGLY